MAKRKKKKITISSTGPIDVTFGAFNIGPYRVPYMLGILKFREVAEYLSLVTDDPKYANQDWSLTQLFQRDVDQARVFDIAKNYLNPRRVNRPAFFNSLTVVLNFQKKGKGSFKAPEPDDDYKKSLEIGPVVINYEDTDEDEDWPQEGSLGLLQWNRDQVYAVAIDGQHRLAAIRQFWEDDSDAAKRSNISVIFIIIDSDMGFKSGGKFDKLRMMRSLFIDLNKHAVPVSRARNLLLDDNDPKARFLRELISPSLSFVPKPGEVYNDLKVGKKREFYDCIPLDLVDWHGESKSKVEMGPYVTSILGLEWIVTKILKSSYPKAGEINLRDISPDDENYWKKLESTLKAWEKTWNDNIGERFKICKEDDWPFVLNQKDLLALSEEFRSLWGLPITRLLTTAGPYFDLAKKRIDSNTISPAFGQWYQAKANKQANEKGSKDIKLYYENRLEKVEKSLKDSGIQIKMFQKNVNDIEKNIKDKSIFFYLVGQRALVFALINLVSSRKAPDWADRADIDLENFKDCQEDLYSFYLVEAINAIHRKQNGLINTFLKDCKVKRTKKELLDNVLRELWAGSLVRRDDPNQIDFSEAAAKRGSKWFVLIAHLYWFIKCNGDLSKKEIAGYIEDPDSCQVIQNRDFGNELVEAISGVCGRSDCSNRNDCPVAFLVMPTDDDDQDNWWKCVKASYKERLKHLLNIALDEIL